MLSDLFADEDEVTATQQSHLTSLADELSLPEIPRRVFAGLKNQGATCYLNSFFQVLYMMPEIRKLFIELDIDKLITDDKVARNVVIALKELFMNMRYLDSQNQVTEVMNKAFGWKDNESQDQHDIQEAIRVVFDYIEKGLEGTEDYMLFTKLLKYLNKRLSSQLYQMFKL